MKLLLFSCLALIALLSLSACEDEREQRHYRGGSVSTTTTEETTVQRPASATTETQTVRPY